MNSLPDDLGPRLRNSLNHGTAPELSTDLVTGASNRTPPNLTNPRRRVQFAGGATALVAIVAVTTVVLGSGLNRPPLFTAAAASGTSGGAASASVPADGLMRIWADYRYHAGAGLSTSGGSGDVYKLTRSGSGSARVDALAAAFGLSGATANSDHTDAANPVWTIGSTDGSTPSVQVTWSGTGDWWYGDPTAFPQIACPPTVGAGGGSTGSSGGSSGATPPSDGAVGSAPDCTGDGQPTGPDKAPTGADARAQAGKIFAKTGLDVPSSDIKVVSDSTQTTATANLVVGEVKTALEWGVTWSYTGKISSAYGESVTAVDRGSYGTISAADAVDRLKDPRWSGSAGPKYQSGVRAFAAQGSHAITGGTTSSAPAPDTSTSSPTDNPSAPGAPPAVPTPLPTAEPTDVPTAVPTDLPTTVPTPEPAPTGPPIINVTIKKAEPTLLLLQDSKGGAWLVPGYAMQVENGWWSGVVSLVPGVIELPPVPTVAPDDIAPARP